MYTQQTIEMVAEGVEETTADPAIAADLTLLHHPLHHYSENFHIVVAFIIHINADTRRPSSVHFTFALSTSSFLALMKLWPPADAAVRLHITPKVNTKVNCIETQYHVCSINYSIDKLITLLFFRSLFNE